MITLSLSSIKHKYTLWYSPKSACSFIRYLFLHLHHDEHPELKLEISSIHRLNYTYIAPDKPFFNHVIFTRNPYDRAVSMYVDKYCKSNAQDKFAKNLPKDLTFNMFLDNIKKHKHKLLNNPFSHFSLQISNKPNTGIMHKLKCEASPENIIDYYTKYIGLNKSKILNALNFVNSNINSTNYGEKNTQASNIDWYNKRIHNTRRSFLDSKAKAKIYNIYEQDFDALGYER